MNLRKVWQEIQETTSEPDAYGCYKSKIEYSEENFKTVQYLAGLNIRWGVDSICDGNLLAAGGRVIEVAAHVKDGNTIEVWFRKLEGVEKMIFDIFLTEHGIN